MSTNNKQKLTVEEEIKAYPPTHIHTTEVNVDKILFAWEFKNLQYLSFIHGVRLSPKFSSKNNANEKWCISILKSESSLIYLQPWLVSSNRPEVHYSMRYCVRCKDGTEILGGSGKNVYSAILGNTYVSTESMKSAYFSFKSPYSTVTILCLLHIINSIEDIPAWSTKPIEQEDLSKLLETSQHSDIALVVGEKELRAHKVILSLRSDVFAAMFEHKDMQENMSNRVIIDDLSESTVKEMLHFIYTGKSPNIQAMAQDLLVAADKYSLKNLKKMCSDELGQHITKDNAISIAILAYQHSDNDLKTRSLEFILENIDDMCKREEWHDFYVKFPELGIDMLKMKAKYMLE
uniref:BTB domain-containing protein n=1 Tax=Stomoxys calcitrans TaxID=35570 RepID=A0A1I8PE97_STOCA